MNQLNLNENTNQFNGLTLNTFDDLLTLVNGFNALQIGDIGQTPVQHGCGVNHLSSVVTNADCCDRNHFGKKVPKDYMCHLCFNKDHFIRDCPLVSFTQQLLFTFTWPKKLHMSYVLLDIENAQFCDSIWSYTHFVYIISNKQ